MDMQAAFPGKYIKPADLGGKSKVITIASVRPEKVGDDQKPVLRFEEGDQGFVVNLTNSNTISSIFGYNTDSWISNRIELYVTKVQFGAEMVDGIRVRMVGEEVDVTTPF